MGKPIPPVDAQLAALNQARLKPPEGFSPLKPFIDFGKAMGFTGSPDRYDLAKKTVDAERTKTAEAIAKKSNETAKTGDDILIQDVLRKNASGETQATAAAGENSGSDPNNGDSKNKKKNKNRKKSTKKS
jgi:hypothetical protein